CHRRARASGTTASAAPGGAERLWARRRIAVQCPAGTRNSRERLRIATAAGAPREPASAARGFAGRSSGRTLFLARVGLARVARTLPRADAGASAAASTGAPSARLARARREGAPKDTDDRAPLEKEQICLRARDGAAREADDEQTSLPRDAAKRLLEDVAADRVVHDVRAAAGDRFDRVLPVGARPVVH